MTTKNPSNSNLILAFLLLVTLCMTSHVKASAKENKMSIQLASSDDKISKNDKERRIKDEIHHINQQASKFPLRVLSYNVGNEDVFSCWEAKLCNSEVTDHIRSYISKYNPDIVLLTEVMNAKQLNTSEYWGPILPVDQYEGICGKSYDRFTMNVTSWNAPDSSHEHECIAWRRDTITPIRDSLLRAFPRNDDFGKKHCHFDATGMRLVLRPKQSPETLINAIISHPEASFLPDGSQCRRDTIATMWKELTKYQNKTIRTIISGDWNAGIYCPLHLTCLNSTSDLQIPENEGWKVIYSNGQYWNLANRYPHDFTIRSYLGNCYFDHAFANFGDPCTTCGSFYQTEDLKVGAAVGGYDGMPRADGGKGCDHRQLLYDIWVQP